MDQALPWRKPGLESSERQLAQPDDTATAAPAATTAQFGGGGSDQPVLIAVIQGPVEAEMAKDALAEASIPAYVKQHSLGQVYGLTIGAFGRAEVWVLPPLAEAAREILIGIGLLPAQEHE